MSWLGSIIGWLKPAATTIAATVSAVETEAAAIPAVVKTTVADVTNVVTALKPISSDFAALEAAWKSKDLQAELAAGAPIIESLLKAIAVVYPPAAAAEEAVVVVSDVLAVVLPTLVTWVSTLKPDGKGGLISESWATDPSHQLDANGNFTQKGIFGL
jgi:hypothetical protein